MPSSMEFVVAERTNGQRPAAVADLVAVDCLAGFEAVRQKQVDDPVGGRDPRKVRIANEAGQRFNVSLCRTGSGRRGQGPGIGSQ